MREAYGYRVVYLKTQSECCYATVTLLDPLAGKGSGVWPGCPGRRVAGQAIVRDICH
jgi:hypothetical protein